LHKLRALHAQKILDVKYSLPRSLSSSCRDLLKRIFVRDPNARANIPAIKSHPWFQYALPAELSYEGITRAQAAMRISQQSDQEIKAIIEQVRRARGSQGLGA
jgi:5'-AMP-activated protein kinase, catalytic alpha subunit